MKAMMTTNSPEPKIVCQQPQESKKKSEKKKDMVMFSTYDKMPDDCTTVECAFCLVEFLPKKSGSSSFVEALKKPFNEFIRNLFNDDCNKEQKASS